VSEDPQDLELRLLVEAIYARYHYDFRRYAFVSLKRRIAGAMARLRVDTVSELQGKVLRDPALFSLLLDFLTVQVTEMFRDPAYFRAMRAEVLPMLATWPSIKVWVAGCATGEEAYSLAILMKEAGLLPRTLIYATDINAGALEKARAGIYPLEQMAAHTANYQRAGGAGSLSDHYTAAYDGAVMDASLRQAIVFADHSLATDSVFAEVQLVSCRNVMIYFDKPLQARAIALFRDALPAGGFLGIGSRESLRFSPHADAFRVVCADERIYARVRE
jgi:chemotaxis protein methyltransferase CheR